MATCLSIFCIAWQGHAVYHNSVIKLNSSDNQIQVMQSSGRNMQMKTKNCSLCLIETGMKRATLLTPPSTSFSGIQIHRITFDDLEKQGSSR